MMTKLDIFYKVTKPTSNKITILLEFVIKDLSRPNLSDFLIKNSL